MIAELVVELLLVLCELFGEFILQVLFECAARLIFSPCYPEKERLNPWVSLAGWIFIGLALGVVSLLLFPNHLIESFVMRGISLFLVPMMLGLFTWSYGRVQDRRDRIPLPLDTFWYGCCFGLAFSLCRFGWAN